MTKASSPLDNVTKFFSMWGTQIYGVGSDSDAFLNALHGRDASGDPVKGWKNYNSENPKWDDFILGGIRQMQRDVPLYLNLTQPKNPVFKL